MVEDATDNPTETNEGSRADNPYRGFPAAHSRSNVGGRAFCHGFNQSGVLSYDTYRASGPAIPPVGQSFSGAVIPPKLVP